MRTKTKRVTLNPRNKSHVRKLGRLLSFSPGFVDYVLTKQA